MGEHMRSNMVCLLHVLVGAAAARASHRAAEAAPPPPARSHSVRLYNGVDEKEEVQSKSLRCQKSHRLRRLGRLGAAIAHKLRDIFLFELMGDHTISRV